jgi:DNA mismatch repair protein MutS2
MNEEMLRALEFDRLRAIVAGYAATDPGAALAHGLEPSSDEVTVRALLRETDEVTRLRREGNDLPFGGVHEVVSALAVVREHGRPLEAENFGRLSETLAGAANMREALAHLDAEAFPVLSGRTEEIADHAILRERIDAVIGPRGEILDDASGRLSRLRAEIAGAEERIGQRVHHLIGASRIRTHLRDSGLTMRNGRFCLPVKAEMRGRIRGILHDRSSTGQTVFIEPEEIVSDGNLVADLHHQERQEVTRVLWELTARTLDDEAAIAQTAAVLADLDLARARARFGEAFGMTMPRVSSEWAFRFRHARHPLLLDLARRGAGGENPNDLVVPCDARLGGEFNTLVITGPNTGGKTVVLKTTGILVLMAQTGLPVPAAEGAEFRVFREVFADIGDEQSLQQSLSTFSSHIGRIERLLAEAGPDTLVLLDELGAGTDPAEGAALGEAILEYLRARLTPVIVTTHIGALKEYAYRAEGVENASVEFDEESLAPTFRLLIGQPGSSNALRIARRLGVPAEVLDQAEELLSAVDRGDSDLIEALQKIRVKAEEQLDSAETYREESRLLKHDFEGKLEKVEERRHLLSREADAEVEKALRQALGEMEPVLRRLGNVPDAHKEDVARLTEIFSTALRATPLGERREAFIRGIKKGDLVTVPRFKSQGRVRRIHAKDRTISLTVGGMEMTVPFEDVSWVD